MMRGRGRKRFGDDDTRVLGNPGQFDKAPVMRRSSPRALRVIKFSVKDLPSDWDNRQSNLRFTPEASLRSLEDVQATPIL